MAENIDAASFASILAGVQKMREAYDTPAKESPKERGEQGPQRTERPETHRIEQSALRPDRPAVRTETPALRSDRPELQAARLQFQQERPAASPAHPPVQAESRAEKRKVDTRAGRLPVPVQTLSAIKVAPSQKGNPLLSSPQMKLMSWSYSSEILSDYYISATAQILFLSLKYHRLRPEYVWRRIEKLKGSATGRSSADSTLRVLLVVVDIDAPQEALRHLLGVCVKHDLSMVVAWLFEEAGNYIAYLKHNEMARARVGGSIQGIKRGDYNLTVVESLTTVRAVNKTDVASLLAHCGSFKEVVMRGAEEDGLSGIAGVGGRKLQNLRAAFTEPFVWNKEY